MKPNGWSTSTTTANFVTAPSRPASLGLLLPILWLLLPLLDEIAVNSVAGQRIAAGDFWRVYIPPGPSHGRRCRDAEDNAGYSDCPQLERLCERRLYRTLMREQCPYTCGYCDESAYAAADDAGRKHPPPQRLVDHPYFPWTLNKSVDPCEDFYHYVCGGYIQAAVVAENARVPISGPPFDVEENVQPRLYYILEHRDEMLRGVTDPYTPMLYTLYEACKDQSRRDEARSKLVVEKLKRIDVYSSVQQVAKHFYTVQTTVNSRDNREAVMRLSVELPMVDIGGGNGGDDEAGRRATRQAMVDRIKPLVELVREDDSNGAVFTSAARMDEIVANWAEIELARIIAFRQAPQHTPGGGGGEHNPMMEELTTLGEFETSYRPSIDIPAYLGEVLPPEDFETLKKQHSGDTRLGTLKLDVKNDLLIIALEGMLSQYSSTTAAAPADAQATSGDAGMRKLKDHAMVAQVLRWAPNLDSRFRNLQREGRGAGASSAQRPDYELCTNQVQRMFDVVLDRLYVRRYFDADPRVRPGVAEMAEKLILSMQQLIESASWMDSGTKQKAVAKVKRMERIIAYPEWIFNDTELSDMYGDLELKAEMSYPEMLDQAALEQTRRSMIQLTKPVENIYSTPSYTTNAFYQPQRNSINILAGALQTPFFNASWPLVLNYGGIGSIIGHEISHGFDPVGRLYNEVGNLKDWWDAETAKEFNSRKQCLIEQYGNYSVKVNETTSLPVNGVATQAENIADNGGVRAALFAFRAVMAERQNSQRTRGRGSRRHGYRGKGMRNEEMVKVRGMEKFNDEQMFFFAGAIEYCAKWAPDFTDLIFNDVHAPFEARVNVVFSNMEEFAAAFNCPKGSRMNPEKKCRVW